MSEKELPKFRILALGKLALQRLPVIIGAVQKDPKVYDPNICALRQMVRQDVEISLVNGIGDLTAAKNSVAEPMLAEQIATAEVYFSGIVRQGTYVPDRAALRWDRPLNFPFFTVTANEIELRYNNTSPSCTATIRGSVVKTLANIPATMVDNFVHLVAFLATPAGMATIAALSNTATEGKQ